MIRAARRTRIVATLGPATDDPRVLRRMLEAGADVLRLNASHGEPDQHRARAAAARRAARKVGREIALLVDLAGPKIRLGDLAAPVEAVPGRRITLSSGRPAAGRIPVRHPRLGRDVARGHRVLLGDGQVALEVISVRGGEVACRVVDGGTLRSRMGVNLPDSLVGARNPTAADLRVAALAVEIGADYVGQSFVQRAGDVGRLRRRLAELGAAVPIVAKIEKPQAMDDLEGILEVADAAMVARGDLGVECAPEEVPLFQKRIIREANARGLPVITATQMLESMISETRPTRAEASDVANAILDGTDAVMLSAETAVGQHPVEAVAMMDAIARRVEGSEAWRLRFAEVPPSPTRRGDATESVVRAAVHAADQADAAAILVYSVSGASALRLARLRPVQPIVVLTTEVATWRRLQLAHGLHVVLVPPERTTDRMVAGGLRLVKERRLVPPGRNLVVVAGETPLAAGSNMLKVHAPAG